MGGIMNDKEFMKVTYYAIKNHLHHALEEWQMEEAK